MIKIKTKLILFFLSQAWTGRNTPECDHCTPWF